MQSRGIRNNNPGNIDFNPRNRWLGQVGIEDHRAARFARFQSPEYGIRAIARLLMTYQDKHKLSTVRKIIHRWAPPVENNTDSYVNAVSKRIGVAPDEIITVKDSAIMRILLESIIQHENGSQPYPDKIISLAMTLAGITIK